MHHRFRAYDKYKGDELIPKPNDHCNTSPIWDMATDMQ